MPWWMFVLAGAGVGVTFGLFGAGGSAFATPVLALMGVPPVLAVASPLPALLPSSVAGAREYFKVGMLDRRVAKLTILAGLPAAVVGAFVGRQIGGDALLIASGVVLLGIGVRMLVPSPAGHAAKCDARAHHTGTVVAMAAGAAFLAGMLANGGGFLLVPLFVLGLGFTAARAAGTALVAAVALVIPTLLTHWMLGDIDWMVAGAFALGMIPASMIGARYGTKLPDVVTRTLFGAALVLFSAYFLITRLG
ncbi:MAG: sulfite exporter TauE/SafE family protein [Acidimicrobiia bacterium]